MEDVLERLLKAFKHRSDKDIVRMNGKIRTVGFVTEWSYSRVQVVQ